MDWKLLYYYCMSRCFDLMSWRMESVEILRIFERSDVTSGLLPVRTSVAFMRARAWCSEVSKIRSSLDTKSILCFEVHACVVVKVKRPEFRFFLFTPHPSLSSHSTPTYLPTRQNHAAKHSSCRLGTLLPEFSSQRIRPSSP